MSKPEHPALDALKKIEAMTHRLAPESETVVAVRPSGAEVRGAVRRAIPALEALIAERDRMRDSLEAIGQLAGQTLLGPDSRHHMGEQATCYYEQGAAAAFEQAAAIAKARGES